MRSIDKSISNRDKTLLVILCVIVIFFLAYYFFIQPQFDTLLTTRNELKTAQKELDAIDSKIASLEELRKQKQEKLSVIREKVRPFFYELKDDRILNQFNTMMTANKFNMQSYIAAKPIVNAIIPNITTQETLGYPLLSKAAKVNEDLKASDVEKSEESTNANSDAVTPDSLITSGITLTFTDTTYASVIGLLNSVEKMDKAIVISSINISKEKSETSSNLLQGDIQYTLYSLAKPDNSEKDYLAFSLIQPQGKADPFN